MAAIRADRAYPLEAYQGRTPAAPSWFQRAIAHAPEVGHVVCDGASIETLSWGQVGQPGVLLLHGAMAHAHWWSHIAPALASGHRVTAVSSSGMGGSDWRQRYSVDQHAREAMAAAETTGLFEAPSLPIVVGHSFGGHAVLRLAAGWGDQVGLAVVLDSAAGSPGQPPRHPVRPAAFATLDAALARFRLLPGQKAEPFVLDWLARNGVKKIDGDNAVGFTWRFDPEIFVNHAPINDHVSLVSTRCPLVFVRGERSTVSTRAVEAGQRAAAPPGTEFVTIPDASHHLMADQPVRLIETLRGLLDRDKISIETRADDRART